MNIIKSTFFNKQFKKLIKKFPKLVYDLEDFKNNINLEPYSDLWNWAFKFRIKNSSIPTGKSGGFRIIVLFLNANTAIPLYIYSKTQIENILKNEILDAKAIVLEELKNKRK